MKRKLIILMFISLIIFILIGSFVINNKIFKINGHSMNPTLYEGDYVICNKNFQLKRYDIIAFKLNNQNTIKRVIGLPNETIDIDDDGNVYIDGKKLEEDYLTSKYKGMVETPLPYKIPSNKYFVLGDNRKDSYDSRNIKVEGIDLDKIMCKVIK